jgi:glutathione S-transferase
MPDGTSPLLFGTFTIADAYFAPVCMRLKTYGCRCPPIWQPMWTAWLRCPACRPGCKARWPNTTFWTFEEPYRLGR